MEHKHFHPFIIGLIFSLLVVFLFVKFFPKYYFDIVQETNLGDKSEMYFFDLDNDGNSEKIHYCHYDNVFQPTLYLYNSDEKFKFLWNFFESPVKNCNVFSGDYDNDKIKEIFVFTEKSDSIFLYVLNSQNDKELIVNRRFIVKLQESNGEFRIIPIGLYNLNSKKNKEFLFAIDAGYSILPRKLFSFDITNIILNLSPDIEAQIINPIVVEDINRDGKFEIMVSNQSTDIMSKGNQAQLIVFDNNLKYLFNPVRFYGSASKVTINTIQSGDEKRIAVLNSGINSEEVFNNLMIYDMYGKRIIDKTIQEKSNLTLTNITNSYGDLHLFSGHKIIRYNSDLELTKSFTVNKGDEVNFIFSKNINEDTLNEFIFIGKKNLVVFSKNLKKRTVLDLSGNGKINATISVLQNIPNKLSVQAGTKWYLVKYMKNTSFVYSKLFFIFISVIVLLVIILFYSVRFKRIRKALVEKNKDLKLEDLEENIDERISGLKDKLGNYKNKINDNSFDKVIDDIDDAFGEVKSISMKVISDNIEASRTEENFLSLIKEKNNELSIEVSMFPDNCWSDLQKETKKVILNLSNEAIHFIEKQNKNAELVIQLISHPDYINLIFETENVFIEKEDFNKDTGFETLLEKVKGKYEINNMSEFGSIINISVQDIISLDNNKGLNRIRVIIAEDHDVSLFGLMSLFKTQKEVDVVGTAKNGLEVLKILESKKTDIVITDISMPGMGGIELSEKLQDNYPDIKVIVFTMYLENWFIEQLINNGAKGFVSKNSKNIELIEALRSVYEGNNYYCPQFKSKFGFKGDTASTQKFDSLTKNELVIVKYYADGFSRDMIADKMGISFKTFDTFLANILLKLNAGDEDEIISLAKQQKIISD